MPALGAGIRDHTNHVPASWPGSRYGETRRASAPPELHLRLAADRFSRRVAQLQQFDRRAWVRMIRGDYIRNSSRECRFAVVHAATRSPGKDAHAPPLFSCRRDAAERAASCAARVCVHERSHKWHESRRLRPLRGSRRSNPFFVLRRVGRKRGRLVRSEFSRSKRLSFVG